MDVDLSTLDDISDTQFAFGAVLRTLSSTTRLRGVFCSQIRAIVKNQTEVSKCLDDLRSKSSEYIFVSVGSRGIDDEIIMPGEFFFGADPRSEVLEKLARLIKAVPKKSYFKSELKEGIRSSAGDAVEVVGFGDTEVEELVELGYLLPRRDRAVDNLFWLSHPLLGEFVNKFRSDGAKLLASVKRKRYKEMSIRDINKLIGIGLVGVPGLDGAQENERPAKRAKREPTTPLACIASMGLTYHLYFLQGTNAVRRVKTPSGDLIRLVNKG